MLAMFITFGEHHKNIRTS